MAGGGEPSSPSPPSPAKHCRSPDDAQPDASPKRRKRHHHRRTHRHRHAGSPVAVPANPMEEDEVEEGEILDDAAAAAAAAAMDVDADSAASQASLAPEPFGNGADTDSIADATKLHASALPTRSSSKDERKSLHRESESGGILSSDAEDTKGYEQNQSISKSPQSGSEMGKRHGDDRHTSSSKDSHSKDHSRHYREPHATDHSRSREKGAEANGSHASLRNDSDHDSNDRNGKYGSQPTRIQENERERSSSRVVRDGHGDRHDRRERYRDDRRHISNVVDRDNVDSHEVTRRYRERSSSRSRSDRRESAHSRDESRERERRSGSSRHKDHERRRDTSKDRHRESDRVDSASKREKVRDDRDREWDRVKGSETRRTGEGRDRVSNSDRHRDSTRSKYSTSDGYKVWPRSGEKARDIDHKGRRSEVKENSFREEDEEEYQEKIEQQLAMQEEDDPEKIKEEARRRKEAIMAKYKQQQLQKQQMESVPSNNNKEIRSMDGDEAAHLKDDNDSSSIANDEAENKHDSSEGTAGEADFTVGKSPARNDIVASAGAFDNEMTIGVSGLGEGTPKSERSADMFCDDIFGESPAGIRKSVSIMKMLDHPNIVNLIEVIDDPEIDKFYMVLEYVEGKMVCDTGLGETASRNFLRHIISGLMYLHSHNIIHGDIKPDNLLVTSNGTVKIGDFSVSQVFEDDDDMLRRSPGTPVFTAPECCRGLTYHGRAADTWAVGVTLYCMILGQYPFLGDTLQETYDKIVNDHLQIPDGINPKLVDLLDRLLCKDPGDRITLDAAAQHPWVVGDEGPIPEYLCRCGFGRRKVQRNDFQEQVQ